jgi:hypothetical protein
LAAVLIVMLFVVMFSAAQRMWIYQREFGLTELRFYTSTFMAWLAVIFVWLAATVLRGQRDRFAFGGLLSGLIVLGILHLANPDALIAQVNLAHAKGDRPLDTDYLMSLSADAVPVLGQALSQLPASDQEEARNRLVARWSTKSDWRTWNLSRHRAAQIAQQLGGSN